MRGLIDVIRGHNPNLAGGSALNVTNTLITRDVSIPERNQSYQHLENGTFAPLDIIGALRACTTIGTDITNIEKNMQLFIILLRRYKNDSNVKYHTEHKADFIHNLCRNNNVPFLVIFLAGIQRGEEFVRYTEIQQTPPLRPDTYSQQSALMIACHHGHAQCVRLLLQKSSEVTPNVLGRTINERNLNGFTPLRATVHCRDEVKGAECMQEILNERRRDNQFACETVDDIASRFEGGNMVFVTPLHTAIYKSNVGAVRLLLRRGAKRVVTGKVLGFEFRSRPLLLEALNLKERIAERLGLTSIHDVHVSFIHSTTRNTVICQVVINDEPQGINDEPQGINNDEPQGNTNALRITELQGIIIQLLQPLISGAPIFLLQTTHFVNDAVKIALENHEAAGARTRGAAEDVLRMLLSTVDRNDEPELFRTVANRLQRSSDEETALFAPIGEGTGETQADQAGA